MHRCSCSKTTVVIVVAVVVFVVINCTRFNFGFCFVKSLYLTPARRGLNLEAIVVSVVVSIANYIVFVLCPVLPLFPLSPSLLSHITLQTKGRASERTTDQPTKYCIYFRVQNYNSLNCVHMCVCVSGWVCRRVWINE